MWRAGFKWMFLIIGTTVGAGYASGRELWHFFGPESGLAIVLFGIFFTICCRVIMQISFEQRSADYLPVLQLIVGKRLAVVYDLMIFLYLFTITIVMIAGSGVTGQAFQLSYWWGVGFISIMLVCLFIRGMRGLVTINQIISPLLLGGLFYMLIRFMQDQSVPLITEIMKQSNWTTVFSFTALTIIPLVAVLGAVGTQIKSKHEILIASVGSGLALSSITYIYNMNLIEIADEMFVFEMPIFAILQHYPTSMFIFISILLWLAIFTTAASGIFGIVTRLRRYIRLPMWLLALILIIIMIPLTTFGFANLVTYTYPIYGVLNLYVLTRLLFYPLWKKRVK